MVHCPGFHIAFKAVSAPGGTGRRISATRKRQQSKRTWFNDWSLPLSTGLGRWVGDGSSCGMGPRQVAVGAYGPVARRDWRLDVSRSNLVMDAPMRTRGGLERELSTGD